MEIAAVLVSVEHRTGVGGVVLDTLGDVWLVHSLDGAAVRDWMTIAPIMSGLRVSGPCSVVACQRALGRRLCWMIAAIA